MELWKVFVREEEWKLSWDRKVPRKTRPHLGQEIMETWALIITTKNLLSIQNIFLKCFLRKRFHSRKQHLLQGKSPTIALSLGLSKCVALRSNAINKQTIRKLTEAANSETDDPNTPTKSTTSASIHNIPENQAVHMVREQYVELLSFSQSNLICVTPSPTRIDSSNPELLQFWNAGIQIVALNQQSEDRIVKMNESLFSSNGSCGYFLKHQLLNRDSMSESPDFYCTKSISISFHYLSILGPFSTNQSKANQWANQNRPGSDQSQMSSTYSIRIEFQGHPTDNSSHVVDCNRSEVMREGVKNVKLAYPDLAFVTMAIIDGKVHSRRSLADYCVPVNSLAHGKQILLINFFSWLFFRKMIFVFSLTHCAWTFQAISFSSLLCFKGPHLIHNVCSWRKSERNWNKNRFF